MTCPRCGGWVYPSPELDGQVDAVCLACGWRAPPEERLPLVRDKPAHHGKRSGSLANPERRTRRE